MSSRALFLGISTLLVWLAAFNTGRSLAFNLAYLLTAILILSFFWSRTTISNVQLRRLTRSRRSQVGQFVEEQFEITNQGFLPKLWLEIEDFSTLPWHTEASRVISNLGRGRAYRWQVRTLSTQRGRFRLGPLSIHSGDPLGIFDQTQQISSTSFVVIYPPTVELTAFEPSISNLAGGEARHRKTYQVTTNAAGVRDYTPGDSLNRIHWASTARTRRLMTKEFELDPTADIWIYLDLYRRAASALDWTATPPAYGLFAVEKRRTQPGLELPPSTTEYAITVAASLARYFLLRNRAVGMNCRGNTREFLQADRGERQLGKILEALAVVEAAGDLPFSHLIATDGIRLGRNDTLLAISADPNVDWAIALQQLQRRGVNSIAVIVDGSTFGSSADFLPIRVELEAVGIPTYVVRRGDPIDQALAQTLRAAATSGSVNSR